jgi:hypothetical protein
MVILRGTDEADLRVGAMHGDCGRRRCGTIVHLSDCTAACGSDTCRSPSSHQWGGLAAVWASL